MERKKINQLENSLLPINVMICLYKFKTKEVTYEKKTFKDYH